MMGIKKAVLKHSVFLAKSVLSVLHKLSGCGMYHTVCLKERDAMDEEDMDIAHNVLAIFRLRDPNPAELWTRFAYLVSPKTLIRRTIP